MTWDTFLATKETIPTGEGFPMFGLCHILWLCLAALVCVVLCLVYRRVSSQIKSKILSIIAVLLLADELFKHIMLLIGGHWMIDYLPLHLCSINIFVCTAHAFRPTTAKSEFPYAVCLPAALMALLFPSWTSLPFGNFMHMHSFTVHILLLLYPLLLLSGGYRPVPRHLRKVMISLLILCPPIYLLNKLTDSNFMFLNNPGNGNPLSLFEAFFGNPGYLIGMPILLVLIWFLLYLPFYLMARGKKKAVSTVR